VSVMRLLEDDLVQSIEQKCPTGVRLKLSDAERLPVFLEGGSRPVGSPGPASSRSLVIVFDADFAGSALPSEGRVLLVHSDAVPSLDRLQQLKRFPAGTTGSS
jgi:hypothetical protein